MNSKKFSEAMNEIRDKYVEEAIRYKKKEKKSVWVKWGVIAACLGILLVTGIVLNPFQERMVVSAYAHDTGEEITTAGVVINSGTISNQGEMKGHPLMFYLSGKDIATVRFSCKREKINFMDWTEKREEYGNAQNFTVAYGQDESEYYYLTIDWIPDDIIRELTDNKDSAIVTLPEEMRSDVIVMEITFENGKSTTKAITVSLLDDGTFYAAFDDYKIRDEDAFVKRPDSEAIPRDILYAQGTMPTDSAGCYPADLTEEELLVIEQTKWGITLSIENVTPVGLTLICTQSEGIPTGELQTDSFYKLKVLNNGTWQDVPYLIENENVAWTTEAYLIPLEDTVKWEVKWEYLYGELPAGTYRIYKNIMDFRGSGDYDTEECWAEFEIK